MLNFNGVCDAVGFVFVDADGLVDDEEEEEEEVTTVSTLFGITLVAVVVVDVLLSAAVTAVATIIRTSSASVSSSPLTGTCCFSCIRRRTARLYPVFKLTCCMLAKSTV